MIPSTQVRPKTVFVQARPNQVPGRQNTIEIRAAAATSTRLKLKTRKMNIRKTATAITRMIRGMISPSLSDIPPYSNDTDSGISGTICSSIILHISLNASDSLAPLSILAITVSVRTPFLRTICPSSHVGSNSAICLSGTFTPGIPVETYWSPRSLNVLSCPASFRCNTSGRP